MNKLQPTSDFIIVEVYKDVATSIISPDSSKGELYHVIDVGPGFITSFGKRIKLLIKPGDIVAIVGNILDIPFQGERYQVARGGDVIAYYRPVNEGIGIPDKI